MGILTNPFFLGAITLGAGVYLLLKSGTFDSLFEDYDINRLSAKESERAIANATKKAKSGTDLFNILGRELSDSDEVEQQLKSLIDR